MSGPGDVCLALEALELNLLETSWVNSVWSDRFVIVPEELPLEYAENFCVLNANETIGILDHCCKVIKKWLSSDSTTRSEGSATIANWAALSDVPYKNLLTLLFFYISNDVTKLQDQSCVELGIKSAELYFSLISIPGSNVYKIFQVAIYEQCLKLFTIYKNLNKHLRPEDLDKTELSAIQQGSVLKSLNCLLIAFKSFVQMFSMKNELEALTLTITALADLTRCERHVSLDEFLTSTDKSTLTPLSRNAYLTLNELCSGLHGRDVDRRVLCALLPNFSLQGGVMDPEIATWPPREHTAMRRLALWYLKTHFMKKEEESFTNVRILIQHLCRSMIDRADYRAKASDLIVSIISMFPEKKYFAMLKWIFREAFNDLVSPRLVALELISKLIFLKQGNVERSNMGDSGHSTLTNCSNSQLDPTHASSAELTNQLSSHSSSEINSDRSDNSAAQARIISFSKPVEYIPIAFRRMMLAIIINRCLDGSASIRAKAFSCLNEIISNRTSPTIQKLVRSVFVDPYSEMNEIKYDENENDFLTCDEFRDVLDKSNWDDANNNILPGATKLHDIILKRCSDEKVMVRRSALMLLSQIYKLNIKWMSRTNIQHFGQHCRDPALSIRKEMQNLITEMMISYPQHTALTRMWVQEVVPLVDDLEIPVFKTALNLLTKTILANIKPLSKTKTTTDLLPWDLINHIAALKNRAFLSLACDKWTIEREPELNDNKIDSVISHIGSAQDTPCWAFLASYSQFVDIKKPQPIMDYYINVIAKGLGSPSVSHLVLKTLNYCCHMLPNDKKLILENELIDSLANENAAAWLVQPMVTLRANLRQLLSEDNQTAKKELAKWTVEMAQICEKRIETSLNPEYGVTQDSCLFHLSLLAAIVDLHPNQISQSTVDCIMKFIKSLKSTEDVNLIKLQCLAIVTMGRISFKYLPIASVYSHCLTSLITHCRNSILLNNIMVTLADIGERFPNLIENFMPSLTMCLKHRSRDVRRIALEIIIQLLQEDYVKSKGPVIYNLMTLINDPVPETSKTVKSYFSIRYLPSCNVISIPEALILEPMFYFNRYRGHYTFKAPSSSADGAAFNISGPKLHGRRLAIYRYLLFGVEPSKRYSCITKVASQILNDVQQNNVDVGVLEGEQLVLDLFGFLLTKNINNEDASSKKKDDDDEVADEPAGDKVDKETERKAYLQIIVNLCINVRNCFFKRQRLHHRFYFFVRELVRDHKSMIKELFQENSGFGEEVLREVEAYPRQDWNENFEERPVEAPPKHVDDQIRKRKSDEHSNKDLRKKPKATEDDVQSDAGSHDLNDDPQNAEVNVAPDSPGRSKSVERSSPPLQSNESNRSRRSSSLSSTSSSSSSVRNSVDTSKLKQLSVKLVRLPDAELPNSKSKKPSSAKGKKQETPPEKVEVGRNSKKRTVRATSENVDSIAESGIMLPPSRPTRRATSTPTVPNRKQRQPLFSSTPLITKPNGFNATDISPVVQNKTGEDEDE